MATYAQSLNSTVKSGSIYTNPPYSNTKSYQFTHGTIAMNKFPGNLDWSDRRSTGADFYGIVITWWSNRGNRYGTTYGDIDFASTAPPGSVTSTNFGLRNASWNSIIYANGVPIADIGITGIQCAGLNKELQPGGTYKTILWVVKDNNAYKFEVSVASLIPGSIPPNLSPLAIVPLSNSPPPGGTNVYLDFDLSHINSSGTKVISLQYYNAPSTFGTNFRILEHTLSTGQFTVLETFTSSPTPPSRNIPVNITGNGGTLAPLASFQYLGPLGTAPNVYKVGQILNPSRAGSQEITGNSSETYETNIAQVLATDYKEDTPVYLIAKYIENITYNWSKLSRINFNSTDSLSSTLPLDISSNIAPTFSNSGSAEKTRRVEESTSEIGTVTMRIEHNLYGIITNNVKNISFNDNVVYDELTTKTASSIFYDTGWAGPQAVSIVIPYNVFQTSAITEGFSVPNIQYFGTGLAITNIAMTATGVRTQTGNTYDFEEVTLGASDLRVDYYTVNWIISQDNPQVDFNLNKTASDDKTPTSRNWTYTQGGISNTGRYRQYTIKYNSVSGWSETLEFDRTNNFSTLPQTISGTTSPPTALFESAYYTGVYGRSTIDWNLYEDGGNFPPPTPEDNAANRNYSDSRSQYNGRWFGFATSSYDNNQIFSSEISLVTPTGSNLSNWSNYWRYSVNNPDEMTQESKIIILPTDQTIDLTTLVPPGIPTQLALAARILFLGPTS